MAAWASSRTSAVTSWPFDCSSARMWDPMNPVAPVSAMRMTTASWPGDDFPCQVNPNEPHLLRQVISYHRTVGESDNAGRERPRWLTAEQLDSWLSVVRLMTWLPWAIDRQIHQRDPYRRRPSDHRGRGSRPRRTCPVSRRGRPLIGAAATARA